MLIHVSLKTGVRAQLLVQKVVRRIQCKLAGDRQNFGVVRRRDKGRVPEVQSDIGCLVLVGNSAQDLQHEDVPQGDMGVVVVHDDSYLSSVVLRKAVHGLDDVAQVSRSCTQRLSGCQRIAMREDRRTDEREIQSCTGADCFL